MSSSPGVLEALDVRSGYTLATRRFSGMRRAREVKYGADILSATVDIDADFSAIQLYSVTLNRSAEVRFDRCTPS